MKHFIISRLLLAIIMLSMFSAATHAVPARRGVWRNITLTDGTTVMAQLTGDEFMHYWTTSDGRRFGAGDNGRFSELTYLDLSYRQQLRKTQTEEARRQRLQKVRSNAVKYTGDRKGIIILVEFRNKKFKAGHDPALYNRIANEQGFTSNEGFVGSVSDYFRDQSNGVFNLTFDVVGPVQVSHDYSYYGKDIDKPGSDQYPGTMVAEACKSIGTSVNWRNYDWNGDGEVDQVMVIYAGEGQADGGSDDTIWPHEYQLRWSDYGKTVTINGMRINTYACHNELDSSGSKITGIGGICHEFSHCLGLPDLYDTSAGNNFGMCVFSPMDSGCYNGDSYVPAGYCGYEKSAIGWLTLQELADDTKVEDIAPLSEQGPAYRITNDGRANEYYVLEYRDKTKWDAQLPARGLMITHVDYNSTVWNSNEVNNTADDTYSHNSHQRCTIFHADNNETLTWSGLAGDLYPYRNNNSLTKTSTPKATVYNKNLDGSKLMNKSVTSIRFTSGNRMAFNFAIDKEETEPQQEESVLFQETFNSCRGVGGNDGIFGGSTILTGTYQPDNEGWQSDAATGANKCARFGTSTKMGRVTTPSFRIDGTATLTFRAAPWNNDGNYLGLSVEGNATIEPTELSLDGGVWNDIKATITGHGEVKVTFTPQLRLFLDEVVVTGTMIDGIRETVKMNSEPFAATHVYDLQGRKVKGESTPTGNASLSTLQTSLKKGLYVINGKKIVIK